MSIGIWAWLSLVLGMESLGSAIGVTATDHDAGCRVTPGCFFVAQEMQLWEIADEVDADFALQAVGGEVSWRNGLVEADKKRMIRIIICSQFILDSLDLVRVVRWILPVASFLTFNT